MKEGQLKGKRDREGLNYNTCLTLHLTTCQCHAVEIGIKKGKEREGECFNLTYRIY